MTIKRASPQAGDAGWEIPDSPHDQGHEVIQRGKRACEMAAAMHKELDRLRTQLSAAEAELSEAKEELHQKEFEAAATVKEGGSSSDENSEALDKAKALARKFGDEVKTQKAQIAALEKDNSVLTEELASAQKTVQKLSEVL